MRIGLMPFLLTALAVYVAAVIETSLADALRIGHVAPDLLALLALMWPLTTRGPMPS